MNFKGGIVKFINDKFFKKIKSKTVALARDMRLKVVEGHFFKKIVASTLLCTTLLTGCSSRYFDGVEDVQDVSYVTEANGNTKVGTAMSYYLVRDADICLVENNITGESRETIVYGAGSGEFTDLFTGENFQTDNYTVTVLAPVSDMLEDPNLVKFGGYYTYDLELIMKRFHMLRETYGMYGGETPQR